MDHEREELLERLHELLARNAELQSENERLKQELGKALACNEELMAISKNSRAKSHADQTGDKPGLAGK